MYFSDICKLINNTTTKNNYGANITKETEREVFCNKKSIGMTEAYELNKLGFKGELKLEVMLYDYSEEEEVIYNCKKYKIQRAYTRQDEVVELTCIKAV